MPMCDATTVFCGAVCTKKMFIKMLVQAEQKNEAKKTVEIESFTKTTTDNK
jgi:hypothetical protein